MTPPRGPASGATMRKANHLTIGEVAEQTGLSASVIRIREMRYGWPTPEHAANGFRYYSESLTSALHWVSAQIQRGRSIGEILRDPLFPREVAPSASATRSRRSPADFSHIPDPLSADGIRLRRTLEQAIATNDRGMVARIQAECLRLKPDERERACDALLRELR